MWQHMRRPARSRNLQIEAGAVEVMPFARIRLRHRLRSPGFVLVTSVPPLETQSANPRRSVPNFPALDHLERAGSNAMQGLARAPGQRGGQGLPTVLGRLKRERLLVGQSRASLRIRIHVDSASFATSGERSCTGI